MTRGVTWFERNDEPPDVAPLADTDERVMLRVSIGQRPEVPRVTIPRLDPPAEAREKGEHQEEPADAAEDAAAKAWPAPKEELERLVREGLSNREIGERYGVSAVTVQARLQQLGIRRDPETRAKLLSRGGRKGRQAGWKQNPLFKPKPAEAAPNEPPDTAENKAPQGAAAQAGDRDPLDEFGAYVSRVIREARTMGLPVDVEIRLRVGGAA